MDYWNSAKASLAQTYVAGAQTAGNLIVSAQHARSNPNLALATPAFFLSECATGVLTIWAACKGKNIQCVCAFGSSMIFSALGAITFTPAWDCACINYRLEKETLSETDATTIKKIILRLNPATIPPDYYTELAFKLIEKGRIYNSLQNIELLKHLTQCIPDINIQEPHRGNTLLLACCKYIQDPHVLHIMIDHLLTKKADSRVRNFKNDNACDQVLSRRSDDTLELFKFIYNYEKRKGYDSNINRHFLVSVSRNKLKEAIFFMQQGATIDAFTPGFGGDHTPLHAACFNGDTALVEYLLYCGADKTLKTTEQNPRTAFDVTHEDAVEIRQMLESDKRPHISEQARELELQESVDQKINIPKFLKRREMGIRK